MCVAFQTMSPELKFSLNTMRFLTPTHSRLVLKVGKVNFFIRSYHNYLNVGKGQHTSRLLLTIGLFYLTEI